MNGTAAGRGRGDRVGEHGDDGDGDGEEAMARIRPSGRRLGGLGGGGSEARRGSGKVLGPFNAHHAVHIFFADVAQ